MKSSTYVLCKRLIGLGLAGGLAEKLDTFFALDRLNVDEYTELMAALTGAAAGEDAT